MLTSEESKAIAKKLVSLRATIQKHKQQISQLRKEEEDLMDKFIDEATDTQPKLPFGVTK